MLTNIDRYGNEDIKIRRAINDGYSDLGEVLGIEINENNVTDLITKAILFPRESKNMNFEMENLLSFKVRM